MARPRSNPGQRKVGLRDLRGFGGIRTRADPGTDPRWIGLCTSQGQAGRAPSRAEQSAGAASSGSDGAARHEGQRAMPRARRNQGDDLPLRSARWLLEKPRATGSGSLGGSKSGPLTCDFAPLLSEPLPVRGCPPTGPRRRATSATPSRSCVSGAERFERPYDSRELANLRERMVRSSGKIWIRHISRLVSFLSRQSTGACACWTAHPHLFRM